MPNPHGYPDTPELDRMGAITDESQKLGEFLEWLQIKYTLCELRNDEYFPVSININQLLAEYFEIDLVKVEVERRLVLAHVTRKTTDKFGRRWEGFDVRELCPECGQPDNCGDCTHNKLDDDDVLEMGGQLAQE